MASWPSASPGPQATASAATIGILDTQFTRNRLSRITQAIETTRDPATGALSTATWGYTYDDLGRLTDVTRNAAPVAHYGYDANGNRTTFTDGWGSGTATYDQQDRLLSYGDLTFTYTANGELRTKTQGAATVTYTYDVLGQLLKVEQPDGLVIDYVLDAANRRIGKKVNGTLVHGWLYRDGMTPIAELDAAGTVESLFVYATRANVPDAMVRAGHTNRLVTDHLGSVRYVVDVVTNAVAQRIDYDAFGRVTLDTNPGFQPFGFAGGLYDYQTGLIRFGARDYDAQVGRWTAKDPIGFGGGDTGLYGYVGGDPVNRIDPTGLADVDLADTPEWVEDAIAKLSDGAAGFGDTISWGLTRQARKAMGTDHVVSSDSAAYNAGEWAGIAHSLASGAVGGLRAAGAKAAGKEFSHAIPNRVLKGGGDFIERTFGRSLLNGNYVSNAYHALSDPFRYRLMSRAWKAANPALPRALQLAMRVPYAYVGTALGAAYGAVGSLLADDREDP